MVTTRSNRNANQASTSTGRGRSNAGRGRGGNNPASGGAPRKVTFLTVKEAFEKLGRVNLEVADGDGENIGRKPVNRKKTVSNKINSMRSFVRKFFQIRKGIEEPTIEQIEGLDWREIFKDGAQGIITFMEEAYENKQTRNSTTGYLKSAIDQVKYRSLGWKIDDYTAFSDFMNEQAASLRAARQKNPVPQVLQDNPNVTWSKLKEVELEWRESQYGSIQHLNLAFRVLLAPKRDDTFSRLKFSGRLPASNESNDKWNYILISDDTEKPIKLDFRRSKTSDSYPRMLLNLDTGKDELAPAGADNDYNDVCPELKVLGEILRKSWENTPRTFVMSTNKDTYNLARTYSVIQDTVEAAIAVRLGVRELRRLAATWAWSQNDWTTSHRIKYATLMEHSLQQSTEYNLPGRRELVPCSIEDIPLADRLKLQRYDNLKKTVGDMKKAIRTAVNALKEVI